MPKKGTFSIQDLFLLVFATQPRFFQPRCRYSCILAIYRTTRILSHSIKPLITKVQWSCACITKTCRLNLQHKTLGKLDSTVHHFFTAILRLSTTFLIFYLALVQSLANLGTRLWSSTLPTIFSVYLRLACLAVRKKFVAIKRLALIL